jgi:predicted DCC family thiol-disulfide oxidoreductase YuxK
MPAYLITDADCGFCQRSAAWLLRHFPGDWENLPNTEKNLALVKVSREDSQKSVIWIRTDGNKSERFSGAAAVSKVISQRGGLFAPASIVRIPPLSWLAEAAYTLIARNRHRLPGASPSCEN